MHFFGPQPWGGALDGANFMLSPVGDSCVFCGEDICANDYGIIMPCLYDGLETGRATYHKECNLRLMVGSVAHQKHQCSCYGGTISEDAYPTRRMAALAAVETFNNFRYSVTSLVPVK